MLDPRDQPPGYFAALVSHRVLRYATGPLHVVFSWRSARPARRDERARSPRLQALRARARPRRPAQSRVPLAGAAWYYLVVNAASVAGLARCSAWARRHLDAGASA